MEQQHVNYHKRFGFHKGTMQCATSAEILSTAAQLYKELHLKRLAIGE